ncbi:hypothetical protein [Alcanivorax sp. DP30]|uniref:hypothetical protein n=1 Tax=Alcanivorax sp. DP30 TaxID=2606217 RepID=UPI001927FF56|nr:hypothetical protein [Alcanivorax sp. DP30]
MLLITAGLALSACQNARQTEREAETHHYARKLPPLTVEQSDGKTVPYSMPANRTDLSRFQLPQTLSGLKLDGEISSDTARTFRYVDDSRQENLQIILTNLPAGWDTMDPQRAVASYYSEARQRRVQKALSNPANALSILSENLMDLEGEPAAQAQMRWIEPNRPIQNQSLLITLVDGTFIRISNASYQQSTRWLLQQAKRTLAEFKAAQN